MPSFAKIPAWRRAKIIEWPTGSPGITNNTRLIESERVASEHLAQPERLQNLPGPCAIRRKENHEYHTYGFQRAELSHSWSSCPGAGAGHLMKQLCSRSLGLMTLVKSSPQ